MVEDALDGAFSDIMDCPRNLELKVTFFPPLHLRRRIWVLDALRQQSITSILDIGCGEGELLNCLCQPAPWLPPHPDHQGITTKNELINLHPTRVAGLDVASDALEFATRGIAPSSGGITRWERFESQIWKGGLEALNEEFVDIECIVAMEVIEHLSEHILSEFAPLVLGVYHPRLLLLTTPSYTFNARFTAPDAPASARIGYQDPTGRTSRVFRHHDHKFEWTIEEFREWCEVAAKEWGYMVETSTVGRASERDEWGRDEELGGASQVAAFKRLDDEGMAEKRAEKSRDAAERASQRPKHQLLEAHVHDAHSRSQKPASLLEIGEKVKLKMEKDREAFMTVEELWFDQDIAILCGGWIELLIQAAKEHDDLTLRRDETQRRTSWRIGLTNGVQDARNFWPVDKENENSLDYIPLHYFPEELDNLASWDAESSGIDGDISAENSGDDEEGGEDFWGTPAHPALDFGIGGWGIQPHDIETANADEILTEDDSGESWEQGTRNLQVIPRTDSSDEDSGTGVNRSTTDEQS